MVLIEKYNISLQTVTINHFRNAFKHVWAVLRLYLYFELIIERLHLIGVAEGTL